MATAMNFFLGANSGWGFHSLFSQLLKGDTYDLVILKGCPGCGKSAFMEYVGAAMEAAGTPVEYIRCAGDPESLDAVLLPELRCAVVDGTAPHILEPVYPLAVQRCVDLGRFCDVTAAKVMAAEIIAAVDAAAAACMDAAAGLEAFQIRTARGQMPPVGSERHTGEAVKGDLTVAEILLESGKKLIFYNIILTR